MCDVIVYFGGRMKIKYKWIFLTITIIVIVSLIISFIIQWNKDNNKNNTSTVDKTTNTTMVTYKFKIFEYEVPEGLKFSDYKNSRFKIEGREWYAVVGMIYDQGVKIYDDVDVLQKTLNDNYDDIITTDIITVDDVRVIVFHREQAKSLLCYFATDFDVDYEVEIYNGDGSYKADALDEIMNSLLNVTYEHDGSNDFYVGRFVSNNLEKENTTDD